MDTNKHELENNAFPLQLRMLEIEEDTYTKTTDSKVVQHLSAFVVRDTIDNFCVDDNRTERNQIWNEFTDAMAFVINRKARLLLIRYFLQSEFNSQRILVQLFIKPMPQRVQNFKGASNDLKYLLLKQQ